MTSINPAPTGNIFPDDEGPFRVQLPVYGLSCASDAIGLERRLHKVIGVLEVTVNPITELAYFTYDPTQIGRASLTIEIERAGYCTG